MIGLYRSSNTIIAVTPDGPRGPRKVAKPGAFSVAYKHGVQIFSVAATASSFWSLPSWDKTIIPKPFSIIHVRFSVLPSKTSLESTSLSKELLLNQKKLIDDV